MDLKTEVLVSSAKIMWVGNNTVVVKNRSASYLVNLVSESEA